MIEDTIKTFEEKFKQKKELPFRVGDSIRVWQKVKEKEKFKLHPFAGVVISVKKPKRITGSFTVRGEIQGIGVERIFPIYSPTIEKIEILKRGKVRRKKLFYLRRHKKKIKREIKSLGE